MVMGLGPGLCGGEGTSEVPLGDGGEALIYRGEGAGPVVTRGPRTQGLGARRENLGGRTSRDPVTSQLPRSPRSPLHGTPLSPR